MSSQSFTLAFDGVDIMDDSVLDALYEAGFDDATFGIAAGIPYASIDRPSSSFPDAVLTAIRDIERVAPGIHVVRVEPDELVNAADIAERVDRSRESVRLLAEGKRGPGTFPPPAFLLHGSQPIWHWSEVARWFHDYAGLGKEELTRADFIAALNGALEVRRHAPHIELAKERSAVAELLSGLT